jgi:cytochrome c553
MLSHCESNDYTSGTFHHVPAGIVGTFLMTRLQLLGLTVAAALFATASVHAEGDKAAGRKLIYTCNGCHGVPGYANAYPNYPVPRIAGQNEQYIVNALHGYKSGDRKHPTMMAQAQSLSDKDIDDIAAYLSSLAK